MIIWLAGLKGISPSYYEAAALDGANAGNAFALSPFRYSLPNIFLQSHHGLIATLQIFTQSFHHDSRRPYPILLSSTPTISLTTHSVFYKWATPARLVGFFSWLFFVLTLLQLKLSKRWVHYEE